VCGMCEKGVFGCGCVCVCRRCMYNFMRIYILQCVNM